MASRTPCRSRCARPSSTRSWAGSESGWYSTVPSLFGTVSSARAFTGMIGREGGQQRGRIRGENVDGKRQALTNLGVRIVHNCHGMADHRVTQPQRICHLLQPVRERRLVVVEPL